MAGAAGGTAAAPSLPPDAGRAPAEGRFCMEDVRHRQACPVPYPAGCAADMRGAFPDPAPDGSYPPADGPAPVRDGLRLSGTLGTIRRRIDVCAVAAIRILGADDLFFHAAALSAYALRGRVRAQIAFRIPARQVFPQLFPQVFLRVSQRPFRQVSPRVFFAGFSAAAGAGSGFCSAFTVSAAG